LIGGKIPWELRNQIHAQFEWCNNQFHCESQCRLFYHEQQRTWAAWFFNQTKTGMTSKEAPLEPDNPDYIRLSTNGWSEFGTWHHHCGSGAFQSGTDKEDESNRPGVHITTGGVNSGTYSLHARFLFAFQGQKWFYENLTMSEFFDVPVEYQGLPPKVKAIHYSQENDGLN
jgi:hypothetical protein